MRIYVDVDDTLVDEAGKPNLALIGALTLYRLARQPKVWVWTSDDPIDQGVHSQLVFAATAWSSLMMVKDTSLPEPGDLVVDDTAKRKFHGSDVCTNPSRHPLHRQYRIDAGVLKEGVRAMTPAEFVAMAEEECSEG